MVRKRSDLEISADVLRIAKEGAKKSHIVYKANLNFKLVKTYLSRLEETGLISKDDHLFRTTPKGVAYLNQYSILANTFNGAWTN